MVMIGLLELVSVATRKNTNGKITKRLSALTNICLVFEKMPKIILLLFATYAVADKKIVVATALATGAIHLLLHFLLQEGGANKTSHMVG